MDIVLKAKSVDIQALEYLNEYCPYPDYYTGKKYPGFQWAVTLAANTEKIEWELYTRIKLENYFTGDDFQNIPAVTHLTSDSEAYAKVANSIKDYFQITRLQNAYCIRSIIKFAVATLKNEAADTKSENITVLESRLMRICENQQLILKKLGILTEMLKNERGRYIMKFEKYAKMTLPDAIYEKDGKTYNQSVLGKAYTRKNKALEQSKKQPVPIEKIIELLNDFLSDWPDPPQNLPRVIEYNTSDCEVDPNRTNRQLKIEYDEIQGKYGLDEPGDIIWLKFTENGHIGVVATGMDVNFSYDNSSGILIRHVKKNWDESFVLIIPLPDIPYGYRRHDIEKAIGNYLIEKEIPIIDFYSHLY